MKKCLKKKLFTVEFYINYVLCQIRLKSILEEMRINIQIGQHICSFEKNAKNCLRIDAN